MSAGISFYSPHSNSMSWVTRYRLRRGLHRSWTPKWNSSLGVMQLWTNSSTLFVLFFKGRFSFSKLVALQENLFSRSTVQVNLLISSLLLNLPPRLPSPSHTDKDSPKTQICLTIPSFLFLLVFLEGGGGGVSCEQLFEKADQTVTLPSPAQCAEKETQRSWEPHVCQYPAVIALIICRWAAEGSQSVEVPLARSAYD